jgi:hypothetical protein
MSDTDEFVHGTDPNYRIVGEHVSITEACPPEERIGS